MSADTPTDDSVSFTTKIEGGRTTITIAGDRDAAVVVRSESGEQIYLPPEDFDRPPEPAPNSPYSSPYASPYTSPSGSNPSPYDSPYESVREPEPTVGLEPTADGFRIIHPEPVTDLRLLR